MPRLQESGGDGTVVTEPAVRAVLERLSELWGRDCCSSAPLHLIFTELTLTAMLSAGNTEVATVYTVPIFTFYPPSTVVPISNGQNSTGYLNKFPQYWHNISSFMCSFVFSVEQLPFPGQTAGGQRSVWRGGGHVSLEEAVRLVPASGEALSSFSLHS